MSVAEANVLTENKTLQKYLDTIDRDAEAALKDARALLKGASSAFLSGKIASAFKADAKQLDKAWGAFNAAWNKVKAGKAKSSAELIKTYTRYVYALEALEATIVKHEALALSNLAPYAHEMFKVAVQVQEQRHKRIAVIAKCVQALLGPLKKAKEEVEDAKTTNTLSMISNALAFFSGPVGIVGKLASFGFTASDVVDVIMDDGSGNPLEAANGVVGDSVELAKKMKTGVKLATKLVSAFASVAFNMGKVDKAKKKVKFIERELSWLLAEAKKLEKDASDWASAVKHAKKGLENAAKTYQSLAKKHRSQTARRNQAIKEFKKWK